MTSRIDFYDDPVSVLTNMREAEYTLIKTANVYTTEELVDMPDNRFALVVVEGRERHRRYLCRDRESTQLSVASFNQLSSALPENMQKVAAFHLSQAADLYEVEGPVFPDETGRHRTNVVVGQLPQHIKVASEIPARDAKELADWFGEYTYSIPPERRREVALGIAEQLEAQGLPAFGKVASYAGDGTNTAFLVSTLVLRKQLVTTDAGRDHADFLIKEAAELPTDLLVRILTRFDTEHGLSPQWGARVPDPWESVYTSNRLQEKTASSEETLLTMLVGKEDQITSAFGESFLADLRTDPQAVVAALPLPEKEALTSILQA